MFFEKQPTKFNYLSKKVIFYPIHLNSYKLFSRLLMNSNFKTKIINYLNRFIEFCRFFSIVSFIFLVSIPQACSQQEFIYLDQNAFGEEVVVKIKIVNHSDSIKAVYRYIDTTRNAIDNINAELGEVYILSEQASKTGNVIRLPLSERKLYFIPFKLGRYAFSLNRAYENESEFILNFGEQGESSIVGGTYVCCCGHPPCGKITNGNHKGCITKRTSAFLACKKANAEACPDAGCVGELVLEKAHNYPFEGIIFENYPGGGIFLEAKAWAGFGFSE